MRDTPFSVPVSTIVSDVDPPTYTVQANEPVIVVPFTVLR
jgi:hypothetical protein